MGKVSIVSLIGVGNADEEGRPAIGSKNHGAVAFLQGTCGVGVLEVQRILDRAAEGRVGPVIQGIFPKTCDVEITGTGQFFANGILCHNLSFVFVKGPAFATVSEEGNHQD